MAKQDKNKKKREKLTEQYINAFNSALEAEGEKDAEERDRYFSIAEKLAFQINEVREDRTDNYTKDTVERLCMIAIIKHNCLFISDVVCFLPFSRTTLYNHQVDKIDTLKHAINYNKVRTKHSMRGKWYQSENATLQVALYKLLASEDELQRLTMNNVILEDGMFTGDTKDELEEAFTLDDIQGEQDDSD